MKIPKVIQLPSGMYFCQLRLNGQSISITDAGPDTVTAKAYAYKTGILKARRLLRSPKIRPFRLTSSL